MRDLSKIVALDEYVSGSDKIAFKWGKHDCCTFASNWVEKSTGVNPLINIGFYGKYKTQAEANTILAELGGLKKVLDDNLGDEIHPVNAKAGDIVMGDYSEGETMGICLGVDSVFLGDRSILIRRTLDMKSAWRV